MGKGETKLIDSIHLGLSPNHFRMTQNEFFALRESLPSDARDQESHSSERNRSSPIDQGETRQLDSKGKRVCVLVGSAILQLPIWGND